MKTPPPRFVPVEDFLTKTTDRMLSRGLRIEDDMPKPLKLHFVIAHYASSVPSLQCDQFYSRIEAGGSHAPSPYHQNNLPDKDQMVFPQTHPDDYEIRFAALRRHRLLRLFHIVQPT